ncbi:hypothetical protein T4D_2687 [Trichinella pseudospiralis]|uniref:Uncharacterized protein n=1 Tax=Trichinella pseudospiralis TaxID=6337 RepID=A0A0V1DQP2_TRIPS|nr:hypothetical protein T4D_2687 [Trichinella pseudospiralis]
MSSMSFRSKHRPLCTYWVLVSSPENLSTLHPEW